MRGGGRGRRKGRGVRESESERGVRRGRRKGGLMICRSSWVVQCTIKFTQHTWDTTFTFSGTLIIIGKK
jgi:hypothetical protein